MAKILIVEDEIESRAILKKILEKEGYEIVEARNGVEAITTINTENIDLVLLDLNLPDFQGENVALNIKGDERKRFLPIIVITGHSSPERQIELLDMGVDDFLIKPFFKPHLLARVRSLLKTKSLSDQLFSTLSGIELLETINSLIIDKLSQNPISPLEFIELIFKQSFFEKPELGNPKYLFIAKDQPHVLTGYSVYINPKNEIITAISAIEKEKLFSSILPYEQKKGIFFSDQVDSNIITTLFKVRLDKKSPFIVVKESSYIIFASGYERSVNFNDSRWLASIGRQFALYITHLNQVLETKKSYLYAVEVLAKASELLDNTTPEHIKRVSVISSFLAENLKCSSSFIEELKVGAMLHDVGKLLIPKEVLTKKNELTEHEMNIIKKHPEYGAMILDNNPIFNLAKEIALHHHEHFDGSGYPFGLKGQKIPLSARIVTIADVYDSLRSERPYKKPLSHHEALTIIKNGDKKTKPSYFDPDILNLFVNKEKEIERIFNSIENNHTIYA